MSKMEKIAKKAQYGWQLQSVKSIIFFLFFGLLNYSFFQLGNCDVLVPIRRNNLREKICRYFLSHWEPENFYKHNTYLDILVLTASLALIQAPPFLMYHLKSYP